MCKESKIGEIFKFVGWKCSTHRACGRQEGARGARVKCADHENQQVDFTHVGARHIL